MSRPQFSSSRGSEIQSEVEGVGGNPKHSGEQWWLQLGALTRCRREDRRAAAVWGRVGQKMKDKESKPIVEEECRGLQGERNKGKEREILHSILAFLFFSHLFSLSYAT